MTDLATRIEQAGPHQQREMLKLAWKHIYGSPPSEWTHGGAFWSLLNIDTEEAFTGAARLVAVELIGDE